MAPLIDVRQLQYCYSDGTKALNGINFAMFPGECVALLGPNGSGKTTLLLHLNGTLSGEGTIHISGIEINKSNAAEVRRKVGVVFQDSDEQLFMPTVFEDVLFGPLNLGWPRDVAEQKARLALQSVGLSAEYENRPPYHLSAGEKKRVALAGVLVMDPEVLVLDEPTTSLDPPGQRALLELLRSIPQPKLIATHDTDFASRLATRAIFLENGQIVADGDLTSIVRQFSWRLYS